MLRNLFINYESPQHSFFVVRMSLYSLRFHVTGGRGGMPPWPASTRILLSPTTAAENSQMKRLLVVASIAHVLLLSQLRDGGAAGPNAAGAYDGEWTGSATSSSGGRCRPANVTLTVQGKVVTGPAKF